MIRRNISVFGCSCLLLLGWESGGLSGQQVLGESEGSWSNDFKLVEIKSAIENATVDTSRIYVIGTSGGGYATLSAFMKSKQRTRKFSAWVPISDLVAWYHESSIRQNKYAGIYDGIQGSVPITKSINFYNKVLSDLGVKDSLKFVSDHEKLQLLEFRRPLGDFGEIDDRKILH